MIAKHDGTERFATIAPENWVIEISYLPVPGGVVVMSGGLRGSSVFVPMCQVEYDVVDGAIVNVHLVSSMAELMASAALAGAVAAAGLEGGG